MGQAQLGPNVFIITHCRRDLPGTTSEANWGHLELYGYRVLLELWPPAAPPIVPAKKVNCPIIVHLRN